MSVDPNFTKLTNATLCEYANAIGMFTMHWAALEGALTIVIQHLLQIDQITAECIATSVEKAAGRTMLIQRLVHRDGEAPSDEWRDCMLDLCDQIVNTMGPKRNRLIHDEWTAAPNIILRRNASIKIGKINSYEPKQLLRQFGNTSSIKDIQDLSWLCILTVTFITNLALNYSLWKQTGNLIAVPELAILLSKGKLPMPDQPTGVRPQSRPGSSQV